MVKKGILESDILLIGFDFVKPEKVLETAYNDSLGGTERFNKNILNVVNRIIKSDFNQKDFDHLSFYNMEKPRIEMHVPANKDCRSTLPFFDDSVFLKMGDFIHTENSHKYILKSIGDSCDDTRLSGRNGFVDSNNWFALVEFDLKL